MKVYRIHILKIKNYHPYIPGINLIIMYAFFHVLLGSVYYLGICNQ